MTSDFPDSLKLRAAHRYCGKQSSWYWGWVAIDTSDSTAVGIVTAMRFDTPVPGVRLPYASVNIVYARRYPGLGVGLLVHARDELGRSAPDPITLYRTGESTSKGKAACDAADLPLDPVRQHLLDAGKSTPLPPYKEEVATYWGRRHLKTASDWFCVDAIAAKAEEVDLLNRLPPGFPYSSEPSE
ncbi:hypothetical protein [Nocardia abscessus]|uniref:hypothetical protein n=1 Tax=Nocardia abscessus TaxID=120957 RepID=UPI0012F78ED2|nr:hypothetical protein [Nocardia abscessus]MCC3332972.1 hypothetical protein [Nocardia abscessus]